MSFSCVECISQPINIGKLRLKNRIMKNGTGFMWDPNGLISDQYLAYFEALAKGGTALISSAVGPLTRDLGSPMPGYRMRSDEHIAGWAKWAETIHRHDALAFHQLFHLGPLTPHNMQAPPGIAPSSISREFSPRPDFVVPREITVTEIEDTIDLFAGAAERFKRAGLDGTELNGACNHLLNDFLSRAWNKRTDEWGAQTIENRTRIFCAIIREIKRRNGQDWPIIALFNGIEVGLKDGITIEESKLFAQAFVNAGADAIEVRAEYYTHPDKVERRNSLHFPEVYFYPSREGHLDPLVYGDEFGRGANVPMAAEIKKQVKVPVIVCGKMDWKNGEEAIRKGQADIISMNRRLMADPELPRKVFENRSEDINPCNSCMTCFDAVINIRPLVCRVNASLGKEREYAIRAAPIKKRILVIGGGPAGMEAARVLALRGHQVVLFEKSSKLGGSLPLAALVKGVEREDIPGLIHYLETQVRKAGVELHLGQEATAQTAEALQPDAIVIAAGGLHQTPAIPGIQRANVVTSEKMHGRLKSMLRFCSPQQLRKLSLLPLIRNFVTGKRVVIVGGRLHGCQTAEYLLHLGRQITIVDSCSREEIGEGLLDTFLKPYLMYWLEDHGVRFITDVQIAEITHQGLKVRAKDGAEERVEADTILTALPLLPNQALVNAMQGKAKEVVAIGDAQAPHLIIDAIAAGAGVGHAL